MTDERVEGWVAVDGPFVSWAVEARSVSRIVAPDAWEGAPPIDVAEALGARVSRSIDGGRVLVVDTEAGPAALLARGSLSLERDARAEAFLTLPPLLHAAGCDDALRGLLLRPSGEARFVISADRLSPARRSPEEDDS